MVITVEQMKRIAGAGGGFVIDATTLTFNQIRDVSGAAQTGKARITLKNVSSFTAVQLQELAALAPGLLAFDLT